MSKRSYCGTEDFQLEEERKDENESTSSQESESQQLEATANKVKKRDDQTGEQSQTCIRLYFDPKTGKIHRKEIKH